MQKEQQPSGHTFARWKGLMENSRSSDYRNSVSVVDENVMELEVSPTSVSQFTKLLKETYGADINTCYQCQKCVSGCPVAYAMDQTPAQLLHATRLGLKEQVLGSTTIWLCTSCETCTTRCPQNIDMVKFMDALRTMALDCGIKTGVPEIAQFYRSSIQNILWCGRAYELGLVLRLKLVSHQFRKDLTLGLVMMKKRKLPILPNLIGMSKFRQVYDKRRKRKRQK